MIQALTPESTVTIVGASLAGLRCAEALRSDGFTGRITLVGDEPHRPYDRPPLSKQFLTGAWDEDRISLFKPERHDPLDLELRLGVRATGLDVEARRVELADGSVLESDAVVVATGAGLRRLPGTEGRAHIHGVRTIDDAAALRDDLASLEPDSRVVLIGAGFIGQEVATAAAAAGHRVTILEGADLPLRPIVGEQVAQQLLGLHAASGAELRCGVKVTGITEPSADVRAGSVEVEGGAPVPADLIVVGIGVTPSTAWLEGSSLVLDNGVVTDERLIAAPGILAIGDVARFRWLGAGHDEQVRIEHWQTAADHGAHAAKVLMAGGPLAPVFAAVPYFWSDQWGKKIQVLGHPGADDEVAMLMAPDDEGRFLVAFHAEEFLTGVLAVSRPRQLMAFRTMLSEGATIDQALAVEL
jgi:NADPH-dependent 2,4-dienoyl-CoA reductase/sulfur reductase-like enzyme